MSTPDLPLNLQKALDALLHGAVGMVREAMGAMSQEEAARLTEAIDDGRAHIAVTLVHPEGAVRVYVLGAWDGERNLWEMTPDHPVMELLKQ